MKIDPLKIGRQVLKHIGSRYLMCFFFILGIIIEIYSTLFIGTDNLISNLGFVLVCLSVVISLSRICILFYDEYNKSK